MDLISIIINSNFQWHFFTQEKKLLNWLNNREILGESFKDLINIIVGSSSSAIKRIYCSRWKVFICHWSIYKALTTARDTMSRATKTLKRFLIKVIQLFTFHMNPNVTLSYIIFTFDFKTTDFTVENYISIVKKCSWTSALVGTHFYRNYYFKFDFY